MTKLLEENKTLTPARIHQSLSRNCLRNIFF